MQQIPVSPYVEVRDRAYYIAGTRISLDSVAYALRRGETVDDILDNFPSLESRDTLEGVIAFIRTNPHGVEAYLAEGDALWDELTRQDSPEIVEQVRKEREGRDRKSA